MGALIAAQPPYPPVYSHVRRLIIVRRDATAVYDELQVRFANDPITLILYDRRRPSGLSGSWQSEEAEILETRGFYVLRLRGPRRVAKLTLKDPLKMQGGDAAARGG
jgi:hypothetical protein